MKEESSKQEKEAAKKIHLDKFTGYLRDYAENGNVEALRSFTSAFDSHSKINPEKLGRFRESVLDVYHKTVSNYPTGDFRMNPENILVFPKLWATGAVTDIEGVRFMFLRESLMKGRNIGRIKKVISHESIHMIQSKNVPFWLQELTADYFAMESGFGDPRAKLGDRLIIALGNGIVKKLINEVGREKFVSAIFDNSFDNFVVDYEAKNGDGSFEKLDKVMSLQNRFRNTDMKVLRMTGIRDLGMLYLRLKGILRA